MPFKRMLTLTTKLANNLRQALPMVAPPVAPAKGKRSKPTRWHPRRRLVPAMRQSLADTGCNRRTMPVTSEPTGRDTDSDKVNVPRAAVDGARLVTGQVIHRKSRPLTCGHFASFTADAHVRHPIRDQKRGPPLVAPTAKKESKYESVFGQMVAR